MYSHFDLILSLCHSVTLTSENSSAATKIDLSLNGFCRFSLFLHVSISTIGHTVEE